MPQTNGSGWDGWKILLLKDLDLGEDFKLPEPIIEAGYVPTPPTANIGTFSVKGSSVITFSEDVFILPNLD